MLIEKQTKHCWRSALMHGLIKTIWYKSILPNGVSGDADGSSHLANNSFGYR